MYQWFGELNEIYNILKQQNYSIELIGIAAESQIAYEKTDF